MSIRVGITGGIGAGKSIVCHLFELYGIPCYDADSRAKQIVHENEEIKNKITSLLGTKAYDQDGHYDRGYVAGIVFEDQEKLEALNNIIHPAVESDYAQWHKAQDSPFTLKEGALLVETGGYKKLDKLIVVVAEQDKRAERVQKRDRRDPDQIAAIMAKQSSDEEKISKADFIIENNGKQSLIEQSHQIWQKLIRAFGQ